MQQLLLVTVLIAGGQVASGPEPPSIPATREAVARPTEPEQTKEALENYRREHPFRGDRTYRVRYVPEARIQIDGLVDEPVWSGAHVEKRFVFPWKNTAAPSTEFRALCDDANLYFSFCVHDDDIVVLGELSDEQDAVFEDRVELYFSRDDQLQTYYCLEIDSRGRVFDYRGSYYRRLEPAWQLAGLETKASTREDGYVVEGRIRLASLQELGFPRLRPGAKIRCGLYRAEFRPDRSGRPVDRSASIHNLGRQVEGSPPIESWISWVDPQTEQPDFHVPSSLGWLEIVR
jgi:hypothetical protein